MSITKKPLWISLFISSLICLVGITCNYTQNNTLASQNSNDTLINKVPVSIPGDLNNIKKAVDLYHITYISDGLKIKGYLATPKKDGTYPVIIFNRGGNQNFGALDDQRAASLLGLMAEWGYVVIASNYRGGGGSEGKDEFGGNDVNDILNLIPLLGNLPMADTTRMGIMGWSRGSMMTYEVMKKTCVFDAAVTSGNLTDLFAEIKERPKMEDVFSQLIPNYEKNKDSILRERSAIDWVNQMCKNTPLLMLEGSADWRVSPLQSLRMVEKLYQLKHPVRFYFFEGGTHGLDEYHKQAYETIREFFDYYVKDQKKVPSLVPHGS